MNRLVVADEERREERLVELTSHLRTGDEVGAVTVRTQREHLVEVQEGALEPVSAVAEARFGGGEFLADALLLALEEVEGNGAGVMGLEQLAALVEERLPTRGLPVPFGG